MLIRNFMLTSPIDQKWIIHYSEKREKNIRIVDKISYKEKQE